MRKKQQIEKKKKMEKKKMIKVIKQNESTLLSTCLSACPEANYGMHQTAKYYGNSI